MTGTPQSAMTVLEPPQVGQVVRVRSRHWVVADLEASTLTDSRTTLGFRQHLVTLRALDDDAPPDETLRVIWEVESDAVVIDRGELPSPDVFDDPTQFDAFLDAVRWGATARVDTSRQLELLSPFRSGIEVDAYQLDPVARALRMPRVALLIADDVGLGKTIEAGLVAQELVLRYRARRILILAPADLLLQWQGEMADRFGLRFEIVNRDYVSALRRERGPHANPFEASNRLIVSYDWLKTEAQLRRFRETLPGPGESMFPRRWDLLILDEAHNVAPAGRGKYAQETQRTRLVRELAPHFEHRLFLTATPHNGYDESFSALLELLDDTRFARTLIPTPDELSTVMVRRMKADLAKAEDGSVRFPRRRVEPIVIEHSAEERAAYATLGRYLRSRRERASDTQRTATEFVSLLLKKRFLSSPRAFLDTVRTHRETLTKTTGERRATSAQQVRVLQDRIDRIEQGFETDAELEEATREAADQAARSLPTLAADEEALLDELETWAERATPHPDAKARAVLAAIEERCRPGGSWSDERLIVFTEYRATQDWLFDILAGRGLATDGRVERLYGGMDTDQRGAIKDAFQAPPDRAPVRILLATDAASEGINLQNHCAWIVHVEIPWNPNRLEQRNGRVDRRGQPRDEVLIQHFAPRGYDDASTTDGLDGDLIFLHHAAKKIERMRERIGSVGTVIARQVEEAMLGQRRALDTQPGEDDPERDPLTRLLRRERDLQARLRDIVERLGEYRAEMRLDDPDNVRQAVDVALKLSGQPPLTRGPKAGSWRVGTLTGSWERGRAGLREPYPRDSRNPALRPIVFDPDLLDGDDYVYAHLEHPLVATSLRRLRAEVWAPERDARGGRLERVTVRRIASPELAAPLALVHARLVVTGASGHRLHEEVITAGGLLRGDRLDRLGVQALEDTARIPNDGLASTEARVALRDLHRAVASQLEAALRQRGRDRTVQVAETVARRGREEAERVRRLFAELEASIRRELDREPPPQLQLWPDDDRRSHDADRRYLEARLAQIPDQAAAEAIASSRRFADPVQRLFPVAVEYRVPARWPA